MVHPDWLSRAAKREGVPRQSLRSRALAEGKHFLALFLYLWVLFGLFVLNERVILHQHGIDFTAHGFAIFNATPDEQRAAADDINRWLAGGKIKACIDRVLPLSQAAAAHRLQEESTIGKSGTLAGRIVLKPD